MTKYQPGDRVRIEPLPEYENRYEEPGAPGWVEDMAQEIGKEGEIISLNCFGPGALTAYEVETDGAEDEDYETFWTWLEEDLQPV